MSQQCPILQSRNVLLADSGTLAIPLGMHGIGNGKAVLAAFASSHCKGRCEKADISTLLRHGQFWGCCARPLHVLRCRTLAPDYSQVTGEELLGLCADGGNVRAWEEFLRRFHPLIISVVIRTARRHTKAYAELVEDLAQDVYLKLNAADARLLREFEHRHEGSAYGYIKVITANLVHDHFRHANPIPPHELPADLHAEEDPDWQILIGEIDTLLRQHAGEMEVYIFWLYYRQGLTAKEIAALPGVALSLSGVESLLLRLAKLARQKLAEGKSRPKSFSKRAT